MFSILLKYSHLPMRLVNWAFVAGGMAVIVLFLSLVNLLLTRGLGGLKVFGTEIGGMLGDTGCISPRVWADQIDICRAYREGAGRLSFRLCSCSPAGS